MTDWTQVLARLNPNEDGEQPVRHRSAVVDAVNADGTVDLDFDGTVVPDVSVLTGASVAVGFTVQVAVWRGDLLVLGATRGSDDGPFFLAQTIYYTGNATWTKADYPGIRAVKVRAQGAGGGGGGAGSTTSGEASQGGGGGAGAYAEVWILEASLGTSETVTVGAGGSRTAGGAGGTGGSSSFGAHAVAAGGVGGGTQGGSSTQPRHGPAGGAGGNASAGDLQLSGAGGQIGVQLGQTTITHVPGGDSMFGKSPAIERATSGTLTGSILGPTRAGCGGRGSANLQSQANALPDTGGPGLVIVEVYV